MTEEEAYRAAVSRGAFAGMNPPKVAPSLRFGSVCSGIEAASVAWRPLGWKAAFFSEIERFPSEVLAHHYPDVPNHGDMTAFKDWPDHAIDLLVGGTPCQSFSVAGLRAGLADPRGSLMLTYLAIAARYRPRWLVWENVPGVLSSNGGRDFGAFLGGLGELGYGFAYRVLDAQYVRVGGFERAVPQRRRRVFVVGYLGDWRRAAAVLFDGASLRGDPAPRREAGQGVAGTTALSVALRGRDGGGAAELGDDVGLTLRAATGGGDKPHVLTSTGDVAHCLNAGGMGRQDYETETMVAHALRAEGFDASEDGTGRGTPLIAFDTTTQITSKANRSVPKDGDPCHPLAAGAHAPAIAQTLTRGAESSGKGGYAGRRQEDDANLVAFNPQAGGKQTSLGYDPAAGIAGTLEVNQVPAVAARWAVRRLTPTECERLQGFPDDYTRIPRQQKGKKSGPVWAADGPRYKALGNSMAVNAMRWIGGRIAMVDAVPDAQEAAA